MRILLAILVQMIIGSSAMAHELRPAYLDMRETATNEFAVLWKVPALDDLRLGLYVRLPDVCKAKTETVRTIHDGAYFERWSVACPNGLKGQEIV